MRKSFRGAEGKIPKFRRFVIQNFPFIEEDFDALTDYGLLCKVVEYLNRVISSQNELNSAMYELKEYVDHYFDSADFQAMVNEKLELMASDGTLERLINEELFESLNAQVSQNTQDIDVLQEKIDYAQLSVTQTLIKDFDGTLSFQGCTLDESDTLYQYCAPESGNVGSLYRFKPLTHQFIDIIENVDFGHGNSLAYKDGKIWAAYTYDNGNDSTKIASYDLQSGTQTVLNPFVDLGYPGNFAICDNGGDELMVGFYRISGVQRYNLDQMVFASYNIVSHSVVEYTTDLNDQSVGYLIPTEIERVGNKLWMNTATYNYLLCFAIDDSNRVLTLEKIWDLGYCDEKGIAFGELEGFSKILSGKLGDNTFVISALTNEDDLSASAIKYYLVNPSNKIKPFTTNILGSNVQMREIEVRVQKSSTAGLLEDGSTTYPFRSLGRAIEYVSNNKLGLRYQKIYINDSSTYCLGQLADVQCEIDWGGNTPTFSWHVPRVDNSKIALRGSGIATFRCRDNSTINIYSSDFILKNGIINRPIYSTLSRISLVNARINLTGNTVTNAIVADSGVMACLRITEASGFTGRLVEAYQGSLVTVNSTFASQCRATEGSVLLTSTSA